MPKNWCLWTVVLKKTPESPLDTKEIKLVNLKRNQPWILVGRRTDAEAECPVFWASDANSWLTGKIPDTGKDRGQKEKRVSEVEMAEWYHQCKGHELGQTSGTLQSVGSQRVGYDWETEQQQSQEYFFSKAIFRNNNKKGIWMLNMESALDKWSIVVIYYWSIRENI